MKRAGRNMRRPALRNKEGGRGINGTDKSKGDCVVPAHLPYHPIALLCCIEGDFEIEIKCGGGSYCAMERG